MREKHIQGGLPPDKIVVKPNFVWPDPGPGPGGGGFALYVGRLAREKGVLTLLDAWMRIRNGLQLRLVGDGPLGEYVERAAREDSRVVWLKRQPWSAVVDLMGHADCLVMPSEWYEPFGRVVIEAYSRGTPVVASDLGASPELIAHGRTGLLFRAHDPEELAKALTFMLDPTEAVMNMRLAARAEYEAKYTGEQNGRLLEEVFAKAIGGAKVRR